MQKECIKSLPENKILLDSNTYFRLADNLYPLLSRKFGKNPVYKLCILSGTLGEYYYQKKLQSKFDWVENQKHIDDRKHNKLLLPEKVKESLKENINFLLSDSNSRGLGCSRFDIECLATALELSILLVTDDMDLYNFSSDYEVKCISTLQLLKLMLDAGRISLQEIQDTVYMWDYMDDLPGNFHADFKRLFKAKPVLYH